LKGAIPPEKHRVLSDRLEALKPLLASFLGEDGGEPDASFVVASSKYYDPRLEALLLLLSSIDAAQLLNLLTLVRDFAVDILRQQGWRLGPDLHRLENAWNTYAEIGGILFHGVDGLAQLQNLSYGWLMSSTRMDFSLTATAMYLEGEFPEAKQSRVSYLCRVAEEEAVATKKILWKVLGPGEPPQDKVRALRQLFGSWEGDEQAEKDLEDLYKSRLYRSTEAS
jgi:hypothetical protein